MFELVGGVVYQLQLWPSRRIGWSGVGSRCRLLACRLAIWVLLLELECAELREKDIVGRRIFGVIFKHGPLEILHCVRFAVQVRDLDKWIADRVTLLSKLTLLLPVGKKFAAD